MKRKSSAMNKQKEKRVGGQDNNNTNISNFFNLNKSQNKSIELTINQENKNSKLINNSAAALNKNIIEFIDTQIAQEVKSARTKKEFSLINKGLTSVYSNNKGSSNNFNNGNQREKFNEIILPIIIKTGLGINKTNLNLSQIKDIVEKYKLEDFVELNIIIQEYKSDDCLQLNFIITEIINIGSISIGFISKDISKILHNTLKFDIIKLRIILDTKSFEIYIILSLAFESEKINFSNNLNKIDKFNNIDIFHRLKSSYMIPIECVKNLNEISKNKNNLSTNEFLEKLQKEINLINSNVSENKAKIIELFDLMKNKYNQDYDLNIIVKDNYNIFKLDDSNIKNTNLNNISLQLEETLDKTLDDDEDTEENKNSSYNQFLLLNIENILSMAHSYNFLFKFKELKMIENYKSDFDELDKEVFSKFLTRSSLWLNKQKLINFIINANANINNNNINKFSQEQIEKSLDKLKKYNFIKNVDFILEEKVNFNNYENLNNYIPKYKSELFTYLYYLTNDEIKTIQKELLKLTKNNKKFDEKEKLEVEEILLNNSFFRLENFMDFPELKKLCIVCSNEITHHNFNKRNDSKENSSGNYFGYFSNNSGPNNKYLSNFLNSTNFKKVKISKSYFPHKMVNIIQIIKIIEIFLNDKSSNVMNNFLQMNNKNSNLSKRSNDDKKEKIYQILKQFQNYSLNEDFAKLFDCASRLFFFYQDYKDINDVAKEFYGFENFEKFDNFLNNKNEDKIYLKPIFLKEIEFKLYDNLHQIKTGFLINSMIFNDNNLNYFIVKKFLLYLMNVNNENLIKLILQNGNNLDVSITNNILSNFYDLDKISEIQPNNDLLDLILNTNFNFVEKDFLSKYKYAYISAELLNYFAETCEKVKNYKLAALIFMFLILNKFLYKKRGLWWYRVILIFNKYLKNKTVCVQLLNKALTDPFIKSGYLVKIKQYYERFEKEKNNLISKKKKSKDKEYLEFLSKKSENTNIINSEDFIYDEKLFLDKKRTVQADSVFSKMTGRRLYSVGNSVITVEDFAIQLYKKLNYEGVHGENMILPALYNIFLWDIIYYDKIPYVFQSPYQTFPLDFFSEYFYLNRKEIIDNRIFEIQNYEDNDIKNTFEYIYNKKKNLKSIFLNWNNHLNNRELLEKITIAIGIKKLALIFKEFTKNIKFMIKGMPDLFLWKENKNNYVNGGYKVEKDSGLLVEVKSKNDKLSEHQKYWLSFFVKIELNVEILHIE